jgi:hypothetical protein
MVRFTVLMTLDCVVVELRCDSDLWSVRSMARFVRQLACMRMSWRGASCLRLVFPISHATPGHSGVDWTYGNYGAPMSAPFRFQRASLEPCALLVAVGWSLPLILHLIPSALTGSATVERLRPR